MWVEFVIGFRPCSERFFSRYTGFPLSPEQRHFPIPIRSGMADEEPLYGCATTKSFIYLFTYLLIYLFDNKRTTDVNILYPN